MWQGRYYSCPLDEPHLWKTLRYAELNPVRAGLAAHAEVWTWSSAAAHCGVAAAGAWLQMETWAAQWDTSSWRKYLGAAAEDSENEAVRQCTHTGRPLGSKEFVHALEQETGRLLAPRKGGRPPQATGEGQTEFNFDT